MRESTKMKRKLREKYPDAKFKVRKKTFSGGSEYKVYTDLIEEPDRARYRELDQKLSKEGLKGEELEEWKNIEKQLDRNKKIKREIKGLLKDHWHVDRDEITGEILLGGNRYLHIERWEKTKYLS